MDAHHLVQVLREGICSVYHLGTRDWDSSDDADSRWCTRGGGYLLLPHGSLVTLYCF